MVKKYGQTVLVTQDLALENYLDKYVPNHLIATRYPRRIQDLEASTEYVHRLAVIDLPI